MAHIECLDAIGLFNQTVSMRTRNAKLNFLEDIHCYFQKDYELLKWLEKYNYIIMNGNEIILKDNE